MAIKAKNFILEGAVDFSSGSAIIGKTHAIYPLQTLNETHCAKRISEMREKNRISIITLEIITALLKEGLTIDAIANRLNCSRRTIEKRLTEVRRTGE